MNHMKVIGIFTDIVGSIFLIDYFMRFQLPGLFVAIVFLISGTLLILYGEI